MDIQVDEHDRIEAHAVRKFGTMNEFFSIEITNVVPPMLSKYAVPDFDDGVFASVWLDKEQAKILRDELSEFLS